MVLCLGKVRYVGEPVAVVIAESRYIAEDATELIEVDYEPLEPVLNAEEAFSSSRVLIHETVGSNIMAHVKYDYGKIDEAMSHADRVLRGSTR